MATDQCARHEKRLEQWTVVGVDEGETMTRNTNRNLYSTTVLNGLVFMTVDLGIVSEKFSNDVTHLFQSESGGVLTKKRKK